MYRLAIRRRVPPDPVALVAPETVAVELRRVIGAGSFLGGGAPPVAVKVDGTVGAGDEVGQNFSVLGRESRRQG